MTTRGRIVRSRAVIATPARRGTTWADTVFNSSMGSGGGNQTLSLISTFDPDERRGMTITRILMCLYIIPDPVGGTGGVQRMSIGVGIASQEAFAAGATPDPEDPEDFPQRGWMYRCSHAVIDNLTPGYPTPVIREDLHAQRKIDTGEPYVRFVNENIQATGFAVRIVGTIRLLLKLP